jgi:hypothetical protein
MERRFQKGQNTNTTAMVISNHIFSVASLRVRDWSPDSSRAAGGLFQQVACESETLSRWLRSQGHHLHAVSLYDKDDRVLSYVPAECLKWYAAPAFARLLLALSPSEQWVVVIRSLFGAEDVLERVRRWHTVEVLDFSPKPLLEALLCCYDSRALQQVMPYLFGDATEVFLIPEAQESPRDAFSKLLKGNTQLRDFQRVMNQAHLWCALLRDSTVLEILSPSPRQGLESYLTPLNQRLWDAVAQDEARMRALLQRYGEVLITQVAHKACEEAHRSVFQPLEQHQLPQRISTSAVKATDVLGYHFLRADTVEFCCAVNLMAETKSLHWVFVRVRFSSTGKLAFHSREVSVWSETIGKVARELYQSHGYGSRVPCT